jgi:hypothetical protein
MESISRIATRSSVEAGAELGRRNLLKGASAAALALLAFKPRRAQAMTSVRVTDPRFGATGDSQTDQSGAFQAALNYISNAGGGALHVPSGRYFLMKPLTYSGGGVLSIIGEGQENSGLIINHSGTALTVNFNNICCNLTVSEIGFSPFPGEGQWCAGAIACIFPQQPGGWQNCLIENCDFGMPFGAFGSQYQSFYRAIVVQNTFRTHINNCNAHANQKPGGIFLDLQGNCFDTRVNDCNIDGYAWGVVVSDYCEGLHLFDTVFIGGTALQTGTRAYNNSINLLGLYIGDCELNCNNTVLDLYQVNSGWIKDSDIYGPKAGTSSVACLMQGCQRLELHDLWFGGFFGGSTNQVGIFATSAGQTATGATQVSNCGFENTCTAIALDKGTYNFIANGIAMCQSGDGALVNAPISWGGMTQQVYVDNSGNSSNDISWLTTAGSAPPLGTGRVGHER